MFHKPDRTSLISIKHLADRSKISAYIVYEDKQPSLWWQAFLKKGYKHSYLVIFDGFFWVKMEYTIGYMDISVLPFYDNQNIRDVMSGRDCTYQYIQVWRKQRYRTLFAPLSCISAIKAALGLRAWHIFTPYQLYKYCEAHHGT